MSPELRLWSLQGVFGSLQLRGDLSVPADRRCAGRVAEEVIVADEALDFEFAGRCGYRSSFAYAG